MNRSSAYNRHMTYTKALRKYRINKAIGYGLWYDNLHEYSKGKIHCSCSLCRSKTNNKNKRGYAPSYNPSIRDARRQEAMDYDEELARAGFEACES